MNMDEATKNHIISRDNYHSKAETNLNRAKKDMQSTNGEIALTYAVLALLDQLKIINKTMEKYH